MEHDHGVNFRPDVGWPDGLDFFMDQYKEGFGEIPKWGECHFLKGKRDPSHMHLEVLQSLDKGLHMRHMQEDLLSMLNLTDLRNPGLNPTWAQKGLFESGC